ncbi:Kinetochore protein Spc24 [Lecanora helva]
MDIQQPRKKIKLLSDDEFEDDQRVTTEIDKVHTPRDESISDDLDFTINEEFARRFEHNKQREELHRLEEKYGKSIKSSGQRFATDSENDDSEGRESSTDSEDEDDDGVLASGPLDAQIQSTLEAIRRKDPRVYDKNAKFYTELDEGAQNDMTTDIKKEKPMYLSDYHRKNLLEGEGKDHSENPEPTSYVQKQDDLKNAILREMHAAAEVPSSPEGDHDEATDDFLVQKLPASHKDTIDPESKHTQKQLNIEAAEKDPEAYLSNFMSARAWVPTENSSFQPFESDDEEEDRRAEDFEAAYNMRFEDPETSNEKLMSHARDAAAKYSVRKDGTNPRKRAREVERIKKEILKQTREEEQARLRKLKVAEAEAKVNKIKDAAGLRGESISQEDWLTFLEEGWDDARWEQAMKERFGDAYYAERDVNEDDDTLGQGRRKFKKPKWDDDIDVDDIVPDFNANGNETPQFELTENELNDSSSSSDRHVSVSSMKADSKMKPPTEHKDGQKGKKSVARQERRKIERLVDQQMDVDETLSNFGKKHSGQFRYRETSPIAYGLTAQDILMASDSQLNQYTGLKKLAAFRDTDKKRKDKKHMGKKARLRQWRKDTFGSEQGPEKSPANAINGQGSHDRGLAPSTTANSDIREGKRRKRSKRKKALGSREG